MKFLFVLEEKKSLKVLLWFGSALSMCLKCVGLLEMFVSLQSI